LYIHPGQGETLKLLPTR